MEENTERESEEEGKKNKRIRDAKIIKNYMAQ